MKKGLFLFFLGLLILSSLILATEISPTPSNYTNSSTNSSSGNTTNSTLITCGVPSCEGRIRTDEKDSNGCYIYACPTVRICNVPTCEGRIDTGQKDVNGCAIYTCPTTKYEDMNSCLDSSNNNYWDQQKNKCYEGFNDKIIATSCSDPDGGINKYEQSRTYGFRSSFADSRDQRIRTGGMDGCYSKTQLQEYYCDKRGFIQSAAIDCPNGCNEGKCIKGEFISEQITCIFKNSEKEQECYLAAVNQEEKVGCKGIESCSFKFNTEKGEKVTWKSSCGGYAYTFQDGSDEDAEFDCGIGETTPGKIVNNGFRTAYWQCYNGQESKDSSEQCKPFLEWQKEASKYCESKCNENNEKCGVNSFSVIGECYVEVIADSSTGGGSSGGGSSDNDYCEEYLKECKINEKTACEKWEANCQEVKVKVCKDSCSLDNKCYPFGYRKSGNYCSDSGTFTEQLKSESQCENNFECSSNVCVSNQCVSEGFIERIMMWFKKLFGKE